MDEVELDEEVVIQDQDVPVVQEEEQFSSKAKLEAEALAKLQEMSGKYINTKPMTFKVDKYSGGTVVANKISTYPPTQFVYPEQPYYKYKVGGSSFTPQATAQEKEVSLLNERIEDLKESLKAAQDTVATLTAILYNLTGVDNGSSQSN